jgi:hypothetical protein
MLPFGVVFVVTIRRPPARPERFILPSKRAAVAFAVVGRSSNREALGIVLRTTR